MNSEWDLVFVGIAALIAGAVNAIAGGGTLITFPILSALGVPLVAASVTNIVALCPGYLGGALAQAHALGKAGQTAEALQIIAVLTERARHNYVAGYQVAIAYMGVDNKEEALRWLEQAFEQRAELGNLNRGGTIWLRALHSDPRYQDMLRRLHFPT